MAGFIRRLRVWEVGRFDLGLCGRRVREKEVGGLGLADWRVPEIKGLKGWGWNGVGWVNGRRDGGLVVERSGDWGVWCGWHDCKWMVEGRGWGLMCVRRRMRGLKG